MERILRQDSTRKLINRRGGIRVHDVVSCPGERMLISDLLFNNVNKARYMYINQKYIHNLEVYVLYANKLLMILKSPLSCCRFPKAVLFTVCCDEN